MNYSYYGGFWRRWVAFGIDTIILQITSVIIFYSGSKIAGLDYQLSDLSTAFLYSLLWSYQGMTIVISMIYFTYFHGTTGQTPGKKILGLKVIQRSGEPMTPGLAFLRWVGYLISKIFLYLGFIWIAFNREKRGWHDMIAGTCVVKIQESGQAAEQRREGGTPFGPTFDSSSPLATSHKDRSQWCMEEERKTNMEHMSKILDKRKEIG